MKDLAHVSLVELTFISRVCKHPRHSVCGVQVHWSDKGDLSRVPTGATAFLETLKLACFLHLFLDMLAISSACSLIIISGETHKQVRGKN